MNRQRNHRPDRGTSRGHRGATLIVGMILLLLMTAVALATLKVVKTDEHLAGNTQDRNLAFQAAEAALREAELMLLQPTLPAFDGSDGLYLYSDAGIPTPPSFSGSNARRYGETLSGVDQPPLYIVERMAPGAVPGDSLLMGVRYGAERRWPYRVTSLGFGGSASTRSVLQTTVRR